MRRDISKASFTEKLRPRTYLRTARIGSREYPLDSPQSFEPSGAGLPPTDKVLAFIDPRAGTHFVLGPLSDRILTSGGLVVDGQYV